jgi:hypothetical protein
MNITLPENFKIVDATAGPVTTNGGVTCDYVSLKNCHRAWILLQLTQAVAHATVIQPQVATAVAPTGAVSITFSTRFWENEDTATTDTLVAQTAATSLTLTADVAKKMVVVQIDPQDVVAQGATYDVLGCTISDSSQATNFVSGVYILEERYPQATPPAAITD